MEFLSQDLLSEFGFEDGDMMYDFVLDHDLDVDRHELLIAVVERLLVPRLDQQVETYTIWATLHNPIRAKTIDGEPADIFSTVTPEIVEIAVVDIIRVARDLLLDSEEAQPTSESAGLGEQAPSSSGRDPQPDVHGVVEFYPEGLLHKFGFGDGDMLYDLVGEQDLKIDHRELLIAVIERLVVPRLDQAVETYTLGTLHNPIRAGTIDGEKADSFSTLTPEVIAVPVTDIIRVASTLPCEEEEEEEEEVIAPPRLSDEKETAPGIADARSEGTNAGQAVADPLRVEDQDRRVLRVFVSSTFRDMAAERDELVKRVFPQLRKLCDERGVTWGEVDLRWGITDEQSAEGKVLPVCLAEIARCRPYFIGLLGERYGWVPDEVPGELVEQESWLEEHADQSVTELEILHGVLNNPDMAEHAFFYLRDPAYVETLPEDRRQDYRDASEGLADKLDGLKERIRQSGFPVREDYPNPTALGQLVREDLTALIDRLFPEGSAPDLLDREAAEHEVFARSRAGVYIGRPDYFKRLSDHADGGGAPLVVVGESGSGKSALLANWAITRRALHPDDLVLMHFVGGTPHSSDWAAMLRRIMGELARRFEIDGEIPDQPDALRRAFTNFLHMAASRGRVILILDALNQLEDRQGALDLVWLPPMLPAHVGLIVSSLPGRPLAELEKRQWSVLEVAPLEPDERKELIAAYLAQYTKQLSAERVERIASAPQAANPLYLRALLEELRVFGVHEKLDERIDHYLAAEKVDDLYERVLERYEEDYERDQPGLVGEAMSLIWAARRGLTETELLDLLGEDGEPLPHALWSPLYLAAEQSLVNRDGLIGFFHDYLSRAVRDRYLPTRAQQETAHLRLADYMDPMRLSGRGVDELPWQLAQVDAWQRLYDLLADVVFLQRAWDTDQFEVKASWAKVEEASPLRLIDAYQSVLGAPATYQAATVWLLANLLRDTGHIDEAVTASSYLCEHARRVDDEGLLHSALSLHAVILRDQGDLDAAMALLEEEEQICRKLGFKTELAISLNNRGMALRMRGDLDGAMILHRESEAVCRELGNGAALANSLEHQAVIHHDRGDLDAAMALFEEEEGILRQIGNRGELEASLGNQAVMLHKKGDLDGAMARYEEQEQICREVGNQVGLMTSLGNQAVILRDRGDLAGAITLLENQERICRELRDLDGLQASLGNQAAIYLDRSDLDKAMTLLEEKERICRQLGYQAGLANSLGNQAAILRLRDDVDGAMALLEEAARICRGLGDRAGLASLLNDRVAILTERHDQDGVMALLEEGERDCRELQDEAGLAYVLAHQAAVVGGGLGRRQEALRLAEEAHRLASEQGLLTLAQQIESMLDFLR